MVNGDCQKLSRYITIAHQLMQETHATQRQMQVVCGGLVYFSTFRRQLLGGLNLCWNFNRVLQCARSALATYSEKRQVGDSQIPLPHPIMPDEFPSRDESPCDLQ